MEGRLSAMPVVGREALVMIEEAAQVRHDGARPGTYHTGVGGVLPILGDQNARYPRTTRTLDVRLGTVADHDDTFAGDAHAL